MDMGRRERGAGVCSEERRLSPTVLSSDLIRWRATGDGEKHREPVIVTTVLELCSKSPRGLQLGFRKNKQPVLPPSCPRAAPAFGAHAATPTRGVDTCPRRSPAPGSE